MAIMGSFSANEKQGASETLRAKLFDAILQGDVEAFTGLCNRNHQSIIEHFDDWRRPPEAIKHNLEEMNTWAHCLMAIAEAFESGGHPQSLVSLLGGADDNPIERWAEAFAKAYSLSDIGRYEESNIALLEVIEEMGGSVGSAIDQLRPKMYGLIGTNYFRTGEFVKARQYTELALADCERTSDFEGVAVYTEGLATLLAMDENTPAAHCRKVIAKAQALSDECQYERSNALLREVIEYIKAHPEELHPYRSKAHGLMGSNYYRLDDMRHARGYTEMAIRLCRKGRDHKGVRVYTENLKVVLGAQSEKG